MAQELHGIKDLIAAREILKSSIEKSKDIASAIHKTGPKLAKTNRCLPSLEDAIRDIASKCKIYNIRGHVDRAIGPAAAALKIVDVVYELEHLLLDDPSSDLFTYLANIKRMEAALKLLTDSCRLVIFWLDDVEQLLAKNADAAAEWHLLSVRKAMRILKELEMMGERFHANGGVIMDALDKLENEYSHLLTGNNLLFPMDSAFSSQTEQSCAALSLPPPVIRKLQAIIETLADNDRLDKCISIHAQVRSSNLRAALEELDVDYLRIELPEYDSVQTAEAYIDQWDEHLEFTVKHLLDLEHQLCNEVYHKVGLDVWMECFAKIAMQSGIFDFIRFGNAITRCKKDAVKLFKLLKIFATLSKLRVDFNRLFKGKACVEIQNQTRDLIKKVVDGACEIFWDLSAQVELQRTSSAPVDGSIPRLVRLVTEYCSQLLEDEYSATLIEVLEIQRAWNHEQFEEGLISNEIHNIMKALELNLGTWAKSYEDIALSSFFLMNNHWYLCNYLKGTKLEDLMGHSWLRRHEECVEHYSTLYLQRSWEKLLVLLHEEDLILFPGGRAVDRELVNKRIKAFYEAFDDMYKKQSNWILFDKGLRCRTCQLLVQVIVPPYKSYLQKYVPLVEEEVDIGRQVKYTSQSLENMIYSLFQPMPGKHDSTTCTHQLGIKNDVTNQFHSTPAAA